LAADYRARVHEFGVHLADQAQAGIRLPRPALPGARGSLERSKVAAQALLMPAPERLEALGSGGASRLRDRIAKVSEEVTAAFDQVLTLLCDDYLAAAPAEVGHLQYDGGAANYARLIRLHTSSDRSAEEIHTIGLEQVAALAEQMASVRAQLGFTGAEAEFHAQLGADSRFYARTPQDVERTFMRHVAALEPHLGSLFSVLPQAPFGVARLAADLEPGMTYGYYQPPTPADPVGRYMYNGSSLDKRSLLTAGTLIFHELAPGHHFHLARQAENQALHPLRRQAVDFGAFNEGWAEYAAGLCHEVGLYADPYDHYGRLAHERFTAQRLVLDTGMNVLGWSLEQARGYMRANTIESDVQIATETLRYSTDLPGQALAYRLGYIEFENLRSKAKRAIGQRFDISQFNETLLGPGALPFSVVADNVTTMITSHA
jgi:uncharacterized protein (DUF885 family)